MRYGLLLLLVSIVMFSCIDRKDYSITSVDVSPAMVIPIAFGDMAIQDMLKRQDSAYVKVYPDDLVYLSYSTELVSQEIRNLIILPDKPVNQSISIPAGTIPAHASTDLRKDSIVEVVDLSLSPEKLSEIDFKAGTIDYSATLLPGSLNLPFEILFTSSDFVSKATGLPLSLKAPLTGSIPLSDYKVTLNKNKFNLKLVLVLTKKSTSTTIAPNTSVAINFTLAGMEFNTVKGFLGDQIVHPPSTTLNIGAFGNSLGTAHMSFVAPNLSMEISNDYGAPLKLDFITFRAQKEGGTLDGQLTGGNIVTIASPSVLGNTAKTTVAVANSKAMMDFGPTEIIYEFNAHMNQGLTTGNNFLADTSKLRVRLNVELPLSGHGANMVLRDTAKLDLSGVSESTIHDPSFKVDMTNEMPMDADIQLYLTDENYVLLDSIFATDQTSLVLGSTVTADGDLETAGTNNSVTALDSDRLNKIFIAKYIIIKAVLKTSKDVQGNTPDVKFKSKYKLVIRMGLQANLDFTFKK